MIPAGLEASFALIRHGESVLIAERRFQGQADSPLSLTGKRQAALVGARMAQPHRSPALPLPRRQPSEVVHSPLRRAAETAGAIGAAIAEASGGAPPLRPEPGLAEIAQGGWEGLHRDEVEAGWQDLLARWRHSPTEAEAPGGERLIDVQARVRPALAGIVERLGGGGGLAAAGAPRRTRAATGGYPAAIAPDTPWSIVVAHDGVFKVLLLTLFDLPLERFWSFPFALCGISVVEIRDGRPILRAHNVTEHLAPLLEERAIAVSEERAKTGAL